MFLLVIWSPNNPRLRRVLWNPWKSNGKLRNMKNQSFEALKSFAISKSWMQGGEAKRNLLWSILEDSHCQPLLEHFLEFNLCILYVVSKLRKLVIQCFKRCMIQSWNEGVTAIGSQSLQVEGKFRTTAKSTLGCKMVSFLLRNFAALLHGCEIFLKLPDIYDRHFLRYFALDIWCLNPQILLVIHLS